MNLRNGQITVREILANPQARMLLQREYPMLVNSPMLRMASGMSLNAVLSYARGRVPAQQINHLLGQLQAL